MFYSINKHDSPTDIVTLSVSESSCSILYIYICCKIHCLDVRDEGDRSLVHLACMRRHKYVVEYLAMKAVITAVY